MRFQVDNILIFLRRLQKWDLRKNLRQSRTALESEAVSHITPVGTMRIITERIDDERIVSEGLT